MTARAISRSAPLWTTIAIGVPVYLFGFIHKGGSSYLGHDCYWYNLMAQGGIAGNPLNSRILVPRIAGLLAWVAHTSTLTAFHVITPFFLLLSLLLLWRLMELENIPRLTQATLLGVFSLHLAVVYGEIPVGVDPLLLTITCLFLLCLRRRRIGLSLLLICLTIFIKDYAVLLLLPWFHVARKVDRKLLAGAFIPVVLVIVVRTYFASDFNAFSFAYGNSFLLSSLMYYPGQLLALGPFRFAQTFMLALWLVGWPVFVLSGLGFFRSYRKGTLAPFTASFGAMLLTLPILFMGNVDRSLHILEPLAFVVAGSMLAKHASRRFEILLVSGVLIAAFIREGWSEIPYPIRAVLYGIMALLSLAMLATLFAGRRNALERRTARASATRETIQSPQ